MKKRINILMSISIVCAAASTSAIAAMCSISNNSTKKYNEAKSRLLNLIKKLDNEGQKKANDFIARQDKKFNSTAFKNHSNTSKLIDEIEIFSKKILENLQKDEKQRLEELNKLNKLRLDLQNLINSNDGQNVDSSDAKKALKENQIDDSLPIDKIKKTNENLENAKKELLNKINAERELQSKIFNDKKQELKRVLDLEDTKEVDFTKEQKVFIETNINETSSIEDIKNKIIEVEKATSSLTSKILNTKQQELQEFENIKKDLQDFINTKLNDAKYQSIKQKALDKINSLNDINKDSTIKEIKAGQNALIKAKEEAGLEKEKLDGQNIKDTLKETINNAKEFKKLLIDNDQKIVDLKSNLDNEISKAEQSLSKDKESMESANDLLNTKLIEYKEILNKFNQEKEAKFNELEQTRKNIENFLTDEVKNNPNYATLVKDLTNAKDAKKSVTNSSNKSDIIAANEALIQALADANKAKDQVDEANKSIKEQLNALIDKANTLLPQLNDNDSEIVKAKESLNAEITNANKAVNQNDNASMQSAKSSLDDKVTKIQNQLTEFNKDKDAKFKELEQTRKDIDNFLTDDVKNNPNYATLVKDLTNAKDAKKSVTNSSNKSDIIAANEALIQALADANKAKDQVDEANKSIKEQLNALIDKANTLLPQLNDNDSEIVKAKESLNAEITNANKAVNQNDNASMQSAKSSLDTKVTEITKKLETFNKDKDAKFKELQQTRKNIDEFIKQIENDPQTKKNYQNIVKNLKDKKAEKNSITFSNNKKEIQDANKSLQDELNNAKITKKGITDFYNSKKQLEDLIKTDDAKKVGTTEADTILDHYKNISDASKNEEIKQATQKINDIKKIIETKIQEKKRNEFSQFEQIKNELQSFINKDLKDQKYNSIRTKIENKINGVSSINKNSKIQDIENAKKQLEPTKNEFEKIINNIKKFNSQKQKVEEKLKFLDTKDIGTSGSLSNKNKDIKAIFQGFINEIEKELINKKADDKAKDECINKIDFLDKALISRYEGILKAAYKFFDDTSVQKNEAEKNEFFDNLRNNLSQDKVFDQLEKMNMNHFEDFYRTFYNKGNAPLKDGKPNYDDPKYKEEINKQNELEGPAVKWSEFDDKLEDAFFWTAKTSFIKKCQNLFNNSTDKYYGTIHKTLTIYNIDIYSKTGRPNTNDLDLRNKDNIFKGYKDVTFEFSTENVPPRWQSNFKGLAKWGGSENRYRFVGIVSINSNYEYNLVTSTKGENSKKSFGLNYKLGSNDKGKDYNPIMIDRISGIN